MDTNVVLDATLNRGQNHKDCKQILDLIYGFTVEAFISSSALLNVFYFLKKEGIQQNDLYKIGVLLVKYIKVIPTDNHVFEKALHAGFSDLEDAVQYFTAMVG